MRITAGKREDILKRKEEHEKEYWARKQRFNEQTSRYNAALKDVYRPIHDMLEDGLNNVAPSLEFSIYVKEGEFIRRDPDSGKYSTTGLSVKIDVDVDRKFTENSALSWNYNVDLGSNYEVIKETSSWSGLKATTEAQIQSLYDTIEALKYLNSLDWKSILSVTLPDYSSYVDTRDPSWEAQPDFDRELIEADLEEAVGKPILFKGGLKHNSNVWYQILNETPKMYEVAIVPNYTLGDGSYKQLLNNPTFSKRFSKDSFISGLAVPLQTKEV